MDLRELLNRLGAGEQLEILSPHWERSIGSLPAQIDFLQPSQVTACRAFSGLPDHLDAPLVAMAKRVDASPDLRAFAWHAHRLLFDELDYEVYSGCRQWPERLEPLGDLTPLYWQLVGLAAILRMLAFHRERGVDEAVSRASCTHFPAAMKRFRLGGSTVDGMPPATLYWLRNHTTGSLYCLGRLEYMLRPFRGSLTAWRHRASKAVVAIAEEGVAFDDEGLRVDPESAIGPFQTTTLLADTRTVTGMPVSPAGYIQRDPVTLRIDEWERALSPGDTVYEVHIPDGGGMSPEACRASMEEATRFFPRHFPETPAVGFACASWILNPEMDRIYRPDTNMVRWQRQLHLYPTLGGDRQGLVFIFGTSDIDVEKAPRDTSIRRAMLEQLETGGRLIGGGMFLLLDELPRYGEEPYRSRWTELQTVLS